MRRLPFQLFILLGAIAFGLSPRFARAGGNPPAPELPDTIPSCPSPQPIAPLQTIGGTQVSYDAGTAIAWNGQDFATAWVDYAGTGAQLKFRRLFADGSPNGPILPVGTATAYATYRPALVWNGAGYGVAWTAVVGGYGQIFFARLNPDGSLITAANNPVQVSFFGVAPTANSISPALAWGGGGYAVAWADYRTFANSSDIYATLLNADGTVANSGASRDLVISNAASFQYNPAIAWSTSGNQFFIVWQDARGGVKYELWRSALTLAGGVSANTPTVSGTSDSQAPSLVDAGSGLGLAWYDGRDGNNEIYFARLDGLFGGRLGADLRLTNDPAASFYPNLVWTGSEYGIFWGDNRGGNYDEWFQRVSGGGAALGGNVQITATADMGYRPQAAFGRHGYLLTAVPFVGNYYPNYAVPVGCASDSTPPTCPANFLAYNITGTTASVSWSPSGDPESDLAYYQVYRNNVPVGKTSSGYYNDSGLPLSSTNNYMIQPVNAWQLQNNGCTSSIYVKTNASLTLMMTKATASDAGLSWTDAGFNNYNLFRGNDPRVMSQTGSTPTLSTTDPNALTSPISYFYSVDNPGP